MSDNREQLLDLSVDAQGSEARFSQVRSWFRSTGWSMADPTVYDPYYDKHPADAFGPRTLAASADANGSYSFVAEREYYFAGEGTEGPVCRRCPFQFPLELIVPLVSEWYDGGPEPRLACPDCSWTGLFGDWDLGSCMAMASFAVIIDTGTGGYSPELVTTLLEALRADLGGRWVYINKYI
ncbi:MULTISPECIES: hypothetical protein [unclassified Arthrobacter]|uniref:hypothetical protein n=1 Tax=unclassified Arthrobacter TaxID=235627 RepID=UPI00210760AD|nr:MULTISPECIES: hypothetical protein [unclassified Arthrobacter]MCQ1947202.1 hypothetical protein [Arthrobacter sp. zg-Y1116]MCQ1986646.1 hypothetical protein [Arthrobacter sp. zg-Y844]MCQ1995311.1 hypothetical protein [Arthrobacter sp. zg-Y1171]UWX80650.1 hypothetical protein N2L00_09375 [Arthrobacter sp. zg-Y1171]